ncbi:MAG: tripartite tricarboxylate transporter substrate binding protein [Paracraurococcus sp.]|jgi:tripartite-type tricarboxylate transporter receptor subunit TctC
MRLHRRALLALPALAAAPALAAPFPDRPVRLIVPFATGGPSDIIARLLVPRMSAELGQPVVVEARPGAGGVTGLDAVAKAVPDGHVIGMGSAGGLVISPSLQPAMPYDAARDFAPISLAVIVHEPLTVPAAQPWRSVEALVAAAKARPGELNYGSTGPGGMPHLAGELLQLAAGIRLTHVPYKGGAPLALALVAREVELGFADLPILLPHVRAGALRALAIGGKARDPLLPEVPTMAEIGLPSVMTDNWHGLLAPAGTPPEALARLHRAATAALTDAEVLRLLREQGAVPAGNQPAEFAAFLGEERARWAAVIRQAGVKLE